MEDQSPPRSWAWSSGQRQYTSLAKSPNKRNPCPSIESKINLGQFTLLKNADADNWTFITEKRKWCDINSLKANGVSGILSGRSPKRAGWALGTGILWNCYFETDGQKPTAAKHSCYLRGEFSFNPYVSLGIANWHILVLLIDTVWDLIAWSKLTQTAV